MSCNGPTGLRGANGERVMPQQHTHIVPFVNATLTATSTDRDLLDEKPPAAYIEVEGNKFAVATITREAEGWSKKDAKFKRGTIKLQFRTEAMKPNTLATLILNDGSQYRINLTCGLSGKPKVTVPYEVL